MHKPILFRDLYLNSAFSPARPDPGHNQVYVKKENGVCPVVSKANRWLNIPGFGVTYELQGVFYPEDKVYPIKVPPAILFHYR